MVSYHEVFMFLVNNKSPYQLLSFKQQRVNLRHT